jgi:hypothetical protein
VVVLFLRQFGVKNVSLFNFCLKRSLAHVQMVIDYSKWDQLKYSSSSSSEDEDEGEKEAGSALPEKLGNLSLSSSSPLWNGLVVHHKDIFVSHVISKLTETDRFFFAKVNGESQDVLKYAGVNVSRLHVFVYEFTSVSTLEWLWNDIRWGKKDTKGNVMDQVWFCEQVAATNKLEFLKWAREVKQCEWDEWAINAATAKGNLEMLKYCFSNECPCDEEMSCKIAAKGGHLDCLRFLVDKVKPSRETERTAALQAAAYGHLDILKYFVEERKIADVVKSDCVYSTVGFGHFDCLKYLVEEARAPLNDWEDIANARYKEHPECVNYLLEKGCPEPTDEQYAVFKNRIGVHGTL